MSPQNPTVFSAASRPPFLGLWRALVIGLLFAGSLAFAGEPIPGVDVKLGKNPGGGITTVGVSDAKGQFVVVVKEPGQYWVSIARKAGKPTTDELSITASGTTLKKRDPMTYDFTVGREPVTLRGKITTNDSPRPTNRSADGPGAPHGGAGISAADQVDASFGGARGGQARRGLEIKGNESPEAARITTAPGAIGGPHRSGGADDKRPDGAQRVVTESNIKAMGTVSTTRGRVEKPGTPDGDETSLPGKVGDPIPGVPIGLEHDPEGARVGTTTTDKNGTFHFGKLPAGKYKLVIAGQPDRLLNVGADGIASGKVMRGDGGSLRIFDRWGKAVAASKAENKKRAAGTENGDVLPGAPVNTTRSNKER